MNHHRCRAPTVSQSLTATTHALRENLLPAWRANSLAGATGTKARWDWFWAVWYGAELGPCPVVANAFFGS